MVIANAETKDLIPLNQAILNEIPGTPSISTVWRWITRGLAPASDGEPRIKLAVLYAGNKPFTSLADNLATRPDMQLAIRILIRSEDLLETLSELAVKQSDLMRLVLQASVAALVNVQSVEAAEGELKRRAVVGN